MQRLLRIQRKLLGILFAFSMLFIGMPVADATRGISERKAEFIELHENAANDPLPSAANIKFTYTKSYALGLAPGFEC